MQTARVTFLTTPDDKAALDAYAARTGHSVGHVLREASSRYIAEGADREDADLAALVSEVNVAMPRMAAAIDRMIQTLDATHDEVDRTLRAAGIRT
jgi:malonyl CoA-acyl carrier protein transacylase